MQKYQAFHVVVLAGLVMAVTFLIFQSRALTIRLQTLEAASVRVEKSPPVREPEPPKGAPMAPTEMDAPPARRPSEIDVESSKPAAEPSVKLAQAPERAELTPAQEQAVAKAVDRILEERFGHLPKGNRPEDLEKTLERELNLTPSQKERIAEILKRKREESSSIFKGSNPFSGKVLQKAMELDAKYDTLVKNELDATQQAKYDQLKKEGKINNGISIQIDATPDED
jgi:Spy/CpxP family protein refolding chaperone